MVGDGQSAIHEVAVTQAFRKLGHKVESFYWCAYFVSQKPLTRFILRAQNKFLLGPALKKLNSDLVKLAVKVRPDIVFIYRGTHIFSKTIHAIKNSAPNCVILGYNNDDPFAEGHSRILWRHFMESIPSYDLIFAYREHNLSEFREFGAKHIELLRSWYLPWASHPVKCEEAEGPLYECDIVFIGHFENDGRLELLEEIALNGFDLRLYGPPYEWNSLLMKSPVLKHLAPVRLIWGEDYNKAICGAKIALCFFSKLNRDTYTRRCFEIPATETLLLSEYSDDLASIYMEGKEADFFRNSEELILKISRYIGDDDLRLRVAAGGRERVVCDGHDIFSRMEYVLSKVAELKSKAENKYEFAKKHS